MCGVMDPEVMAAIFEQHIPFNRFLGMRAVRMGQGGARLELPFRDEFVGDPMRPALHGGVISTLADAAGGMAIWSALENPASRISTIDLRIDYLRPGRLERLVAEATTVRVGKAVGVADIRLFHPDAEGEVVATGKAVYAIKTLKQRWLADTDAEPPSVRPGTKRR
jgi:uncharacterized protein (TIGR00369 family)